jgi:hypothetical protein
VTAALVVGSAAAAASAAEAKADRGALVGAWTSQCHRVAWPPYVTARDRIVYNSEDRFTKATDLYTDTGCRGFEAALVVRGRYDLVGRTGPGRALIDLEYTVADVIYTPLSPELAATMSEGAFCGFVDWRAGEARSIAGRTCFGQSLERDLAVPEVLELDKGKLRAGAPTIWLTDADGFAHPDRVDERRTYKRLASGGAGS